MRRALLFSLTLLGCSPRSPAPERPLETSAEEILVAITRAPAFAAAVHDAVAPLPSPGGFRTELAGTRPLSVTAPATAGRPLRIADAADEAGFFVELEPLDAHPVLARRVGNALTYAEAAPATDVVHLTTRLVTEELRVMRDARAPKITRYAVKVGPRVATLRLREGRVELADGTGYVRIASLPATAVDHGGVERALELSLAPPTSPDGAHTLTVKLDTEGLAYPIVVDPAWSSAASMSFARDYHVALTLTDGRAMAIGQTGAYVGTSVEIYNPTTNTWTTAASLPQPHQGAAGTVFTAGARAGFALVAGGGFTDNTASLYNPTANTWAKTPAAGAASDVTLTLLADGIRALMVKGGATTAERYDSAANTWSAAGTMSSVRGGHTATRLPDGTVLVVGGNNGAADLSTCELYNPTTNTWSAAPSLPAPRAQHTATLAGTYVIVAGGGGLPAYRFDTATKTWSGAGALKVAHSDHEAALTATGKVVIVGGGGTSTAEIYDPATNTWSSAGAISQIRPGARATVISTGVLVTGGADPITSPPSKLAEIYRAAAIGASCVLGSDCDSGSCVDEVCCSTASCGAGMRCDRPLRRGTCSRALGDSCALASECETTLCVDGVCCGSTCTSQCAACNLPGKSGTCAAVLGAPVGSRAACTGAASADPCVRQQCDGSDPNKCYLPAAGKIDCGAIACSAGTETHLGKCDGAGKCDDVPKACGDYTCGATRCNSSCATNADCVAGRYCDTTRAQCVPLEGLGRKCSATVPCAKGLSCTDGYCCGVAACDPGASCGVPGKEGTCSRINGSACKLDSDCGSLHCADGVCCDRACGGQCEACDVIDSATGLAGKCVPIRGAPHGARAECEKGVDVCSRKQCDGAKIDGCAGVVGSETVCRSQFCSQGVKTTEARCDGSGKCPAEVKASCDGHVCRVDGLDCDPTCATDIQCMAGFICTKGLCEKPTDRCSDDHGASLALDGTRTECAPYACRTNGRCASRCGTSADCARGFLCDSSNACVPSTSPVVEEGGGCALSGGPQRGAWPAFALLLGALLGRRRRWFVTGSAVAMVATAPLGCDGGRSAPAPSAAPALEPLAVAPAAQVVDALRRFPAFAGELVASRRYLRTAAGFTLDGTDRGGFSAVLPGRATLPLRLSSGEDPAFFVDLSPAFARDVAGVESGGAIVYPGAFEGADLVHIASPARVEDLRILRTPAASARARWRLRLGPGVANVRVRIGRVEFVDAKGRVQISSEPMFAVDSIGTRRVVTPRVEPDGEAAFVLETSFDDTGLTRPIAVDPPWGAVSSMIDPRVLFKSVALPGGKVLAIGGSYNTGGSEHTECELYDATSNTWSAAAPMAVGRKKFTASYLAAGPLAGKVLVTGGSRGCCPDESTSELYDVATNKWSSGPNMKARRSAHEAVVLAGGTRVLVVGGALASEVFDSATSTFTSTANEMSITRTDTSAVLLPTGNVLIVGGSPTSSAVHTYRPATNTFVAEASYPGGFVQGAAAALVAGKAVFAGGLVGGATVTAAVYSFDPASSTWTPRPSLAAARNLHMSSTLASGGFMVVGGSGPAGYLTTAEIYDPSTGAFAPAGSIALARAMGHAVLDSTGAVVVSGGKGTALQEYASVDRYRPSNLGTACTAGFHCASGFCTNGVCCDAASCAGGGVCSLPKKLGTCAKVLGLACAAGTECESGNCADGVCCTVACSGQCEACNLPGKAGTCSPVTGKPIGARAACATGGADPCATTTCDGVDPAKCRFLPAGKTACGANACAAGIETRVGTCNGAGKCDDVSKSCGAYACSGTSCATTCTIASDCASGFYCDDKTKTCVLAEGAGRACVSAATCASPLSCTDGYCCGSAACPAGSTCGFFGKEGSCIKINGTLCKLDAECGSGHCVDGVCCDSACSGQCEACDQKDPTTDRAGRCVPVTGPPRGSRAACASDPGNVCSGSQCGGTARDKCTDFVGSGTSCRPQSCKDGVLTVPALCDGKGSCPAAVTQTCGGYACADDARCGVTCSSNKDCAPGVVCDGGACVKAAATCSSDGLSSIPNGGAPSSCAPYRCTEAGSCGSLCHSSNDCAPGFACESTGVCSPASAATDSGGCQAPPGGPGSAGALVLLALLAPLARRRRPTRR